MHTFVWILTVIGSIIGGIIMIGGAFIAKGAPQEAASAALGIGFGVLPYCFARAVTSLEEGLRRRENQERVVAAEK